MLLVTFSRGKYIRAVGIRLAGALLGRLCQLRMTVINRLLACCSLLVLAGLPLSGQTFDLNGPSNQGQANQAKKSKSNSRQNSSSSSSSSGGIGWGSSIEVSRQARAAEDALRRGRYSDAAVYAERAAKAAPQVTDFWFLYGYASRLAGHYQQSVEAFQRGLQNQPNSVRGLSGLAQTYARMGRSEDAKKLLLQVIQANPKSADDILLAGELFLNTGDAQRAVELLQRGASMKPSARSDLLLAKAYQRDNQLDKARQYLENAKKRAPRDPQVLSAVAGYYREAHDYKSAIATLQSIPKKSPEIHAELGYTYSLAGKRNDAADSYVKAANALPQDMGFQLSAAQALISIGELKKAGTYIQRASTLDPNHYRVHALRGEVARLESRNEDAIREYQIALKNLPEGVPEGVLYPVELHMALAEMYRETQNEDGAAQQVDQAAALISKLQIEGADRPEFLRLRAAVEMAQDNNSAADKDLQEASSLDPQNAQILLQYANLLWRMKRTNESVALYNRALKIDPNNRFALTALGYLCRELGNIKAADNYFHRAAAANPNDYVPYLAMGDMYSSLRQFAKSQENYQKAYRIAPEHPLIIAGATNAALESHNLPLAKGWLDRANAQINQNPNVMREHERYLTWTGHYAESAELGWKVIEKLPKDTEGSVYLAYDLLYMGRYDDALQLVNRYEHILKNDRDLPLIAGHVHAHAGLLSEANDDFTRALQRDPTMAVGYVNRGYVLNDLQQARQAQKDFEKAIEIKADYGEAHLGLAFANLQLRHSKAALDQANIAMKLLGPSHATHLALATAYRYQQLLPQAEKEYQAALKLDPNDLTTHMALAETLYREHRYSQSIDALNSALTLSPGDPNIYAQIAHDYARLGQRDQTFRFVQAAEHAGRDQSQVLLATGDALYVLGDRNAAMERFSRALDAPDADRVGARLEIAKLFAHEGRFDDAREQVSLGFAEARIGEGGPVTPDNMLDAADVFLTMHDFDLATKYFERAKAMGADESVIAIGLANAYLAQGQTQNAEAQLASLGNSADYAQNYDYTVAMANVYRQRQDNLRALSAFARANGMGGEEDDNSERAEFDLAGVEGRQINDKVSVLSEAMFTPLFEDVNIYQLDARLRHINNPALLPPPRHSFESRADARYRIHLEGLPVISGLLEERNARGQISFPSELLIENRNTYDTIFNGGINPIVRLGSGSIAFNPGIQFTLRRDTEAPSEMNQNLFRQFLYVSTSSFLNWISVRGDLIHESGPFTQRTLSSRDVSGQVEFTVGRPWGKNALVTGYAARDLQFDPFPREYYTTSAYVGWQRKFGQKLTIRAMAEDLRSWRVEGRAFAIAQSIRPFGQFSYRPNNRWSVEGSFVYSRGQGFHLYDNVQSEFLISYVKPVRHTLNDVDGSVPVRYPFKFSFGVQQQNFYNFTGGNGTNTILPVIRVTLF